MGLVKTRSERGSETQKSDCFERSKKTGQGHGLGEASDVHLFLKYTVDRLGLAFLFPEKTDTKLPPAKDRKGCKPVD